MDLVKYPEKVLTQPCADVEDFTSLPALVRDMVLIMDSTGGVGIAAPQVGVPLKVIVLRSAQGPMVLVNPEFTWKSRKLVSSEEGCLSFPGLNVRVQRHKAVNLSARDLDGNQIELEAVGKLAVVAQHEVQHLEGVTILSHCLSGQKRVYLMKRGLHEERTVRSG